MASLCLGTLSAQTVTSDKETCEKTYNIKEGREISCECNYVLINKASYPVDFKVYKDCGCVSIDVNGEGEIKEGTIPANSTLPIVVRFKVDPEDIKLYDEKIKEIKSSSNSKLAEVGLDFTGTGDFIQLSSLFHFKFQ